MSRIQLRSVPDEWVEAAEEQDLSLAEYGRRMINAGRRQFGYGYEPEKVPAEQHTLNLSDDEQASSIDGELKEWIYRNLSTEDGVEMDELVSLLEDDLLELADDLQDEGRAKYRRSEGGFLRVVDDE